MDLEYLQNEMKTVEKEIVNLHEKRFELAILYYKEQYKIDDKYQENLKKIEKLTAVSIEQIHNILFKYIIHTQKPVEFSSKVKFFKLVEKYKINIGNILEELQKKTDPDNLFDQLKVDDEIYVNNSTTKTRVWNINNKYIEVCYGAFHPNNRIIYKYVDKIHK